MSAALDISQSEYDDALSFAARRDLWRYGNIAWKLRPEQLLLKQELERCEVQLAVFNICRRLGKTYTLVLYAIEQAMLEKQKIRYGCAFLTDLEEFVLPAFALILEDCPDDLRPHYHLTRKTWIFPNGSEIKLVGLDKNPNGLRGNAIAKIIIDEAGFVSNLKFVYTSVIIPATAKQKNIKVIFLSTPPPTPEHFFVTLMDKAQSQPNGFYKELTIDDISDLDPVERQRLLDEVGGEQSIEAQREFFCRIIIDVTIALAPEFDAKRHVKECVAPEFTKFWVSGDTGGVRDRTVFHLMTYDFRRAKIMVLDEIEFPSVTGSETWVAAAKKMEAGRPVTRFIDADGQMRVDLQTQHGYPVMLPRKDELTPTVNQVRVALRRDEVEIDPKCVLLIKTLKGGTLNPQRTDLARTEALGHMDAFMSFAYGMRHANRANPFPQYGVGVSEATHFIRPNQTPTATKLRGLFRGAG